MALTPRATPVLQWLVQRVAKSQDGANRIKTSPSSDWGLKLAPMKPELLVMAGQQTAVNTFSGLVHTARQITKVGSTRSAACGPKVSPAIGVKS